MNIALCLRLNPKSPRSIDFGMPNSRLRRSYSHDASAVQLGYLCVGGPRNDGPTGRLSKRDSASLGVDGKGERNSLGFRIHRDVESLCCSIEDPVGPEDRGHVASGRLTYQMKSFCYLGPLQEHGDSAGFVGSLNVSRI